MAKCISKSKINGVPVTCGKCLHCKARRISGWSFRLNQESKLHDEMYFLTFTYDNDHVPITKAGYMNLNKNHFVEYIRELRRGLYSKGIRLKYYVAGEYGTKSFRPHYHAIIFGCPLGELIGESFVTAAKARKELYLQGEYEFNSPLWKYGYFTIGEVNKATIGYTLKYISKSKRIPLHKNDDRQPEFQLNSKGLGANYLTTAVKKWHKQRLTERVYLNIDQGKKIAMPRYYKDKIYTTIERGLIGLLSEFIEEKQIDEKHQTHTLEQILQEYDNEILILVEDYHKGNRKKLTNNETI